MIRRPKPTSFAIQLHSFVCILVLLLLVCFVLFCFVSEISLTRSKSLLRFLNLFLLGLFFIRTFLGQMAG